MPQREKQCCQSNYGTVFYLIKHRLHLNFRDAKVQKGSMNLSKHSSTGPEGKAFGSTFLPSKQ